MAYAQRSTFSPRRAFAFVFIVLLHVGFVYTLNAGLAQQAVERVFGPIETKMIEEVKDEKKEPPPPPPKMEIAPPPFVPPPDVIIDLQVEPTATTAITATTKAPPKVAPPPVKVDRTQATRIARRDGSDNPEYPPQSKRLGEEGLCVLTITVSESGHVDNVILKQSSGFPRLDEAAIKHLQRQGWKFKPAMENGKPVATTLDVPVRWKITTERDKTHQQLLGGFLKVSSINTGGRVIP